MITMRRFEVAVGGEESTLSAPAILLRPGAPGQIMIQSNQDSDPQGWSVEIGAEIVPGGFLLKGADTNISSKKE